MTNKPFKFKEFTVLQDKCAMKVGTDGVLLGAWVKIPEETSSILDIGTGTGLIALQLAQRSGAEIIDALEIEADAFEQAVENFENSLWSDRLYCYHASVQEYQHEIDEKYDLIVSNPPYFKGSSKGSKTSRSMARHNDLLNFDELLKATDALLSQQGSCAFVIPFSDEKNFISTAASHRLFPNYITRVRGREMSPFKRSLLQLSRKASDTRIDRLTIEIERHVYTDDYRVLVRDFYLKL
jgi:tRNA1Val (adenine37-N6)-methyltransferase